jgi:hypothetical protein
MSLLERVLKAQEEADKNKLPCEDCKHLLWLKHGAAFCKIKDKFLHTDFPPTKCNLRESEVEG